jgi:flagellar protein FliO/FliZ
MTQTLLVVVLFVGAVALLPWFIRRVQQRQASGGMASGSASRVLSAIAVGPQQRVVTVEVGPEHARTWLVLGVTAQNVSCLHVLSSSPHTHLAAVSTANGSFAQEVAEAVGAPGKTPHV